MKLLEFTPGLAISVNVVPLSERYSLKATSLFELSVQVSVTWVEDNAVATRLDGAAGITVAGAKVVAVAVLENAVLPEALKANTR